jgi:hypothetical protein
MTTILLIVGFQVVGFFILFILLKRRIDRRIAPSDMVREVRNELNSIMVELNRITNQNIGLIEDKINQLKEFLTKADKRLSLLKREEEKHEVSKHSYLKIVQNQPENRPTNKPADIQKEVIRLHREGFTPGIIAGHIGTTIGEVELIISLEERKI